MEHDADTVRASMTHATQSDHSPDPDVEAEVIDDMRLLRDALIQHGFRPSRKTKRKWLRQVYGAK